MKRNFKKHSKAAFLEKKILVLINFKKSEKVNSKLNPKKEKLRK